MQLGRFTWDALSLSRGLAACLLVLIILVAARLFGQSGIIAALAALLALLGTVGWHGAARLHMIAAFTLSGALLSLLASLLATYGGIWSTLPLVFLVVAGGGLLYGAGSREAYAGLQLGVAMLAVLALADSIAIWQPALSFLVGGGLVFLLFLLRLRFAPADPAANPPPTEQPLRHSAAAVRQHLTWESVVLRFALVRAAAVTTAYGVGIAYFAAHPFLAATATLLIIRPAFDQTFVYAIERSLGTLLGAAVGIWLITIVQHPLPQLGTSLLLSFAMGRFCPSTMRSTSPCSPLSSSG